MTTDKKLGIEGIKLSARKRDAAPSFPKFAVNSTKLSITLHFSLLKLLLKITKLFKLIIFFCLEMSYV